MIEAQYYEKIKTNEGKINDNGFRVYRFKVKNGDNNCFESDSIIAYGTFIPAIPGVTYLLAGKWKESEKYGKQYQVKSYELIIPKTRQGIINFLTSGIIDGVTPSIAENIYSYFGNYSIEVLDNEPDRIIEVPGIGVDKAARIKESYIKERVFRTFLVKYKKMGVSEAVLRLYCKDNGFSAIHNIEKNPYLLCHYEVALSNMDKIADENQVSRDCVERICAIILQVLKNNEASGHTCMEADHYQKQVLRKIRYDHTFHVSNDMLAMAEELLLTKEQLVYTEHHVFRAQTYHSEMQAAKQALRILYNFKRTIDFNLDEEINKVELELGIRFHIQQREAIKKGIQYGLSIICGFPGTGKTSVLIAILIITQRKFGASTICVAPTGRAAARMSESCKTKALTIHKKFGINQETLFDYSTGSIPEDICICDETSMLDIFLAAKVFSCIASGHQLILVGDVEQLPSIGPGAVLRDMIDSGVIPITALTKVFRQENCSNIYINCRKIVKGNTSLEYGDDFSMIYTQSMHEAAQYQVDCFLDEVEHYGLDEVCLLCCHRIKGSCCLKFANSAIQASLNPPNDSLAEITYNGTTFRVNDRVMHERFNNEQVCNGELGYITDIANNMVTVNYSNSIFTYGYEDLQYLSLAYAMSIYKSQGSEFKCCICSLLPEFSQPQYGMMLQMNLLNTAVSRAKERFIIIGNDEAINIAIMNRDSINRITLLREKINYYSNLVR